jgi:hypothetical protein
MQSSAGRVLKFFLFEKLVVEEGYIYLILAYLSSGVNLIVVISLESSTMGPPTVKKL